ncbi:hypothetical protein PV328_006414 [Microctonus aethiopoides]|uniref:Peroxidase n=1 Tax=Microctonus aethiopoides TaxID=144406 RepID=A0AA39FPH7_9HYME|nr:hypothetical protein PV328_006414 [Microctonus aethiopoides]
MYFKVFASVIGIITLLLMPGFTSKPGSQIEWPRRDMDNYEQLTTRETRRNINKKNTNGSMNIPDVRSQLKKRQEDFDEAEDFGIRAMNEFFEIEEPKLFQKGLFLNTDHPARYVAAFNRQTDEAKYISKVAYAALEGSRKLIEKFGNGSNRISLRDFERDTTGWSHRRVGLRERCPRKNLPHCPPASLKYRTADGTCNNLEHPWWGSAMSTMQRFLAPVYDDGVDAIRRSAQRNRPLPSSRLVSTTIHGDKDVSLASVTHMLMQFGQFIDHDMTATAQSQGFNGTFPQCCRGRGTEFQPPELMHPDCMPISVDQQDHFFGRFGVRCLEFVRSGPAPREDCGFGSREQLSQVTSYLDASMIYSSNARHSDSLRIFRNGLLQYGKLEIQKPQNTRGANDDICRRGSLSASCFRAGDARLTEQPGLTSLHVVFLRLHNRIATELSQINPQWSDEKVFQETRKIIGAIIQHITYNEYLPIVVGPEVMKIFDLELKRSGYYNGYNSTINPNIANEFSTAAYRFGHSLVQRGFSRYDRQHHLLFDNVTIHEEFSNRANLHSAGSVDRLLLGLVNQPAQRRDEYMSTELTNKLFQLPGFLFGMDLAAINIQRGRDHGLAPYIEWRELCGLSPIRGWPDMERVTSPTIARKFRRIYESIQDIDLFSAGLSEKPVLGGLVGPTFACIIAQQFSNLRKGDRFWYENDLSPSAFTPEQLDQIRRIKFAQVLCRTLDNIDTIQPFVFLTSDTLRNERISCNDKKLGKLDLRPWMEVKKSDENFISSSFPIDNNGGINNSNKIFEQAKTLGVKKMKPIQTNVHQKNRIIVRRPVGTSQDNVTIIVNNHAVNSPIFVNDAIYGSNFHATFPINPITTSSLPPLSNNDELNNEGHYSTIEHNPTRPAYQTHTSDSYIPVTLQDPNNPNPPNQPIATTDYSTNYPKLSTNHHNDAWINIGPLLDQLKPDWHKISLNRPTPVYELRLKTGDKSAKINDEYEVPKPLTNDANNSDDDVTVITEDETTAERAEESLEMTNDSTMVNENKDTESNEVPRPIRVINNGF